MAENKRAQKIGALLKAARYEQGIKIDTLQKETGLSTATIYKAFKGQCTLVNLLKIARIVHLEVAIIELNPQPNV